VALLARGYSYGEPFHNYPPPCERGAHERELLEVDLSSVKRGDVFLQTTRPPLHDRDHGDRKRILRGETFPERCILSVWERCFAYCARSHVKLAAGMCPHLLQGYESRRDMAFYQTGPWYKELNALEGSGWKNAKSTPHRTAAFLLRVDEVPGLEAGLIGSFAMDGVSNLVWAYRLRQDWGHLLEEPGFAMVEMEGQPIPERPTDLRSAMDWNIELILRHRM